MSALDSNLGPGADQPAKSRPENGALEGLKQLDASDLPRWKAALERGRESGFGAYFPFLLAHQRPGRRTLLITEDAGCLCVFARRERKRGARLDLYTNPVPMDPAVTRRCLDRANDFNRDRSARILRIDGNDASLARRVPGLDVRRRRMQYLFAPRAYGSLSGGKYRTVRYHVSRVRRLPGLEVAAYHEGFAPACQTLLAKWSQHHRSLYGSSGDAGMSKRALALTAMFTTPDLVGEVVLVGERVVGFAFGGEIRPGLGCLFEAKTDLEVPGLAHFQFYNFMSKLNACEMVNSGSDARRAGLRQLKDSLRPIGMLPEYRGLQVAS